MRSVRSVVLLTLALVGSPLLAATFVVTSTADSGSGSLRQAILDANGELGSSITFAIGTGTQRIRPLSELPALNSGTIDGTTQPGYAGSPLIEIDGSLLPAFTSGLNAGNGVVRALVINRCGRGLRLGQLGSVTGSFIGTDVTGSLARPNGVGILINGPGVLIGGNLPADRNVMSGNGYGIVVSAPGASIIGNLIGTNAAGTAAVSNQNGISVEYVSGVTIVGNVLSGNTQYGIDLFYATDSVVVGNLIGPSAFGLPFPSAQRGGIQAYQSTVAQIGGLAFGEPNVIAYNVDIGIGVESGSKRIRISGNSIHSNGFGIDLDFQLNPFPAGPRTTPNDLGDPDIGGNLLQNFPVLESVRSAGGSTLIRGKLNSSPNEPFRIEFFSNAACHTSGFGEGRTYIGFANVVTDSADDAAFEIVLPVVLQPSEVVTATATDQFGDSSEFSACEPVGLRFFTVEPCRVLDTRDPDGAYGGPAVPALGRRDFAVAGRCSIPATARSVSVNVTVTQPAASGHLTIHSSDTGPPLTSTINFGTGQTRANNAILRLSTDGSGAIAIENGSPGTVHVILDATGYFE